MSCALVAALVVLGGSLFLPMPSTARTGGPDAYGYIWVDNRLPTPTIPYGWIDIRSTGIRLSLKDDGCTYEIPLGFQFRYYGTTVDQVYVCSNGFITFSVPDSYFAEPPIPSPNPPNDRIVALGLDLDPGSSGGVYFLSQPGTTPQRFILTWQAVNIVRTTNPQTFQIILEQNRSAEDGRVRLQYMTLTAVTSALVGIENTDGSSGLAYPGPMGNNLAVWFFPPSDATLPPDRLTVSATVLAPATVAQGRGNVPMLALDLSTTSNWVDVTTVRITLSGLGAASTDVPTATLWLEASGDTTFTPGPDTFLGIGSFSGGPPRADINLGAPLRVALGAPRRVYVAYDVAASAGVGDYVGARLPDASSVLVVFPDTVMGAFPIDTYQPGVRTRIVASADTLSLARADSRIPSTIRQWETDRPILSLRFSADKNDVAISGIHVPFRGTVEARDLWAVKAVRDLDADGNYTPDVDAVLAVAVPSGAPAEALLSFNLSVVYGSPENLLLTLDVAPDAATGHTLSVLLLSFDIRLPPGSADRVDGGNFPATSGNATIATGPRPALVLPWSDFPPQANGAWRTDEYVLNPASTVTLMRPGGNQVSGILTAENNATTLFLAIGATHDVAAQPGDGASVAFDTDGNGLPTDGADDVFAVNASGGSHWRYNAAVSGWRQVEPCSPGPSASTASCASGIGFTQVGRTAHQFYEFSIPLAVLGVTSPPPPGTALRFALSGPPYNGLADTTLHSTWPLLFGPPIAFFGELRLNSGATPNQPPVLNWTGEPGYENDAVEPGAGAVGDAFLWRIAYFDADNDRPALGYPQLHIYRNSVEIPDSPFQMTAANEQDAVYTDGKTFVRAVSLTYCGGTYAYILTARDARGLPVPETVTPLREGPVVRCPNESPMFSQEGVTPFVGETGTAFAYRVAYQDPEGQPPLFIDVVVQQSDVNLTSVPLRRIGWLGAPDNYTQGAWYEENVTLTDPGTDYTFQFRASDGTATFLSSRFLGPYVTLPPPDKMSVLGLGNLAPPVVNEGARPIPFLRLTLSTSDADIDVISLLVDRVGTASVDEVLAVNDTDGSSSWTPQDVLLDVRSGAPPQITLSVPVHVVPGNPVYVLILANLTAPGNADATVGFEIRDPSYFTVAAGDAVLPFAPIRSSRASVNVAPKTAGLTVDGRADGTPGINHIVPDRPSLAWRFQDENIADVAPAGHNVSVWTSSPDTLLWYVNESNSASAVTYVGPALIDGASYVLRIRSTDGRLWSAVTEARFQMNRPPAAPALLSPLNTALGLPAQLDLHWSAVTDPDGDAIMYHWWVSEAPGFVPSMGGDGAGTSAAVVLAQGREYYWKVGASDGYEFVGNATVWSFQTAPAVVPTLGEVRGRVMNGSVPLSGALIELLVGDSVVAAAITTANGTFRLPNLALRPYTVRVSAFGFQPRTIVAEPTQGSPVVDLLDIPLSPVGGPPGGTPPPVIPMWQLALFGGLLISALVIAFLSLAIVLRRRREDVAAVAARGRSGKSVTRTTVEAAAYACPVCGREVEAGATRCECGAVFER